MLVLVTGGNGFIGSHLVEALVRKDYEVRCMVRKTSNLRWLKDVPVEYVYGDVTNPDSLASAVRGVDYVYHIAGVLEAKRTETFYKVNVQGTEHLLQACVEHAPSMRRFVYASSQSAAGPCTKGTCVDESDHPNPMTHYGRSNLQAEEVVLSYNEKIPLPIDANTIHKAEILVTGSEGRTEEDFLQAVRLLIFGKIKVRSLISQRVPFSGLEAGIKAAMTAKTYRVLLDHEAK